MSNAFKPAPQTPTSNTSGAAAPSSSKSFMAIVLDMAWQLAIVVLVPMLLGVFIGKKTHAKTAWVLAGFAAAMVLSGVVIWRFYKQANSLPVPKMTAADKARLNKMNQEDDQDA